MALVKVRSDLTASVWKVEVEVGQAVAQDDVLAILESMKTEIPVNAPVAGIVVDVAIAPNDSVTEQQVLFTIER